MKSLLLFLIQRSKWYIAVTAGIFILILVGLSVIRGGSLEDGVAVIGFYAVFISMLWNISLPGIPSVDEDSSTGVVLSRWILIIGMLLVLIYIVMELLYL